MRVRALILCAGTITAASCGNSPDCCKYADASLDATDPRVEVVRLGVTVNRDLDVLWVIDDSPGTLDAQTNLKNNFPNFINVLNTVEGGLPNLHMGVVSSDVGTQGSQDPSPGPGIGSGPGSCSGVGKAGNLLTSGASVVQGTFISDTRNTDGTRNKNYTGTLENAFSAIASVGASGCGFEQPLAAVRRALSNNPANAGFLRPSAHLAVLFLTDEDDCSMAHSSLLGSDTSTLGPLQSFRCTRFGITCDTGGTNTDEMNTVGAKTACHSNEGSQYLDPIARHTAFLKGLKVTPDDVYVGVIAGDRSPVSVELRTPPGDGTAIPALTHSCSWQQASAGGVADPAVRLSELAISMPQHSVNTVCNPDLSDAVVEMAIGLWRLIGDACVDREIRTPYDCVALETSSGSTQALPSCESGGSKPCWELMPDPTCAIGPKLRLIIQRDVAAPADTIVSLRCTVP